MKLRITIVQFDIEWEDKKKNLDKVESLISGLKNQTDLVVLPEMFTTGFSMNSATLAEENSGYTVSRIKDWALQYGFAVCGSFIAKEDGRFFNRGFFISPDDATFYNKRHLFRMGDEPKYFSQGKEKVVIEHKGFRICLLVCYDLRFPVWARNVDNEYDLLIYAANWPVARIEVWKALLVARAIENMSFVCGVNRIGQDGLKIAYNGNSMLVDVKGRIQSDVENDIEQVKTYEISKDELDAFRQKFPVWKDADDFEIKY